MQPHRVELYYERVVKSVKSLIKELMEQEISSEFLSIF